MKLIFLFIIFFVALVAINFVIERRKIKKAKAEEQTKATEKALSDTTLEN